MTLVAFARSALLMLVCIGCSSSSGANPGFSATAPPTPLTMVGYTEQDAVLIEARDALFERVSAFRKRLPSRGLTADRMTSLPEWELFFMDLATDWSALGDRWKSLSPPPALAKYHRLTLQGFDAYGHAWVKSVVAFRSEQGIGGPDKEYGRPVSDYMTEGERSLSQAEAELARVIGTLR